MSISWGKLHRQNLSLAGEFAVASELCKRDIYAQLTLGNRKRTDLLIDTIDGLYRVEVKSKQNREWPGVRGIYLANSFIVFVDFYKKEINERPDFYILSVRDWKRFARKKVKDSNGRGILNDEFVIRWFGYDGVGIKPIDIIKHKEAWDKFSA